MGNQIWSCDYCYFPNYGDQEFCMNCSKHKITGDRINSNLEKNSTKNKLKSLKVSKSSELRIKMFKRASKSNPDLTDDVDHFIDDEFPPNKKSIFIKKSFFRFPSILHSAGLSKAKFWLRPTDVNFTSDDHILPVSLYQTNSSPKDVVQGGVGSCWFISALSVIALRPELLSNILITKYYNSNGLHQIRLCKRGEWVVVNIDDYLPCDKNGKITFAYAKQKQFWVSFIEKALAKLYGNYESIASGACVEGLQTLTGEPCEIVYLENAKTNLDNPNYDYSIDTSDDNPAFLWNKLMFAKRVGYLMTTLCYNKNMKFIDLHKVGLFNRHIYSVLDVREFDDDGKIINLIKLRNPWGKKEWKGAWSNKWPHWPEHIKSQLSGENKSNEGCFWISFQDLLKYFYDISICKVRSDWFESRHSSYFYNYSEGTQVFILNITNPGEHQFEFELFSTGQKFNEFDRNADPDIDLCLIVCKVNDPTTGSGLTCVIFEHNVEYFINLSSKLTPGYYLIFATSIKAVSKLAEDTKNIQNPNLYSYNLVIHGQTKFCLNQLVLPSETVTDIFYSVAQKCNRTRYELNGILRTLIIPGSCTHGIIVENLSNNFFIKVSIDSSQSKNLESTRNTNNTQDLIAPGQRQLLCYLTPRNYRKGFVIGYRIESQIVENVNSCFSNNNPSVPHVYSGLHSIKQSKI